MPAPGSPAAASRPDGSRHNRAGAAGYKTQAATRQPASHHVAAGAKYRPDLCGAARRTPHPARRADRRLVHLRCSRLVTSRGAAVPVSVRARLAGSGSAKRSTCGVPGAYRAAPATYAATMYVAWRSKDARARSYRMVVLGSAWEAASCTSRNGTPESPRVSWRLQVLGPASGSGWF